MELTYAFLYNQRAFHSLSQLYNTKLDSKLSYDVSRLFKKYEKQLQVFRKEYTDTLKKYVELDDKGEIKMNERMEYKIKDGSESQLETEMNTLLATKFELPKVEKIPVEALLKEGVKLAPVEWELLEPILEGVEF